MEIAVSFSTASPSSSLYLYCAGRVLGTSNATSCVSLDKKVKPSMLFGRSSVAEISVFSRYRYWQLTDHEWSPARW